jgi:hypothetical protein
MIDALDMLRYAEPPKRLPGDDVEKHMGPGPHPSGTSQDVHAGGRQTRSVGGIKAGDVVWRKWDMKRGVVVSITPSGNIEWREDWKPPKFGPESERKPEVDILGVDAVLRKPDTVRDEIHKAFAFQSRLEAAAKAASQTDAGDLDAADYLDNLGGPHEPLVKNGEALWWLRENGFEDVADQLEYESDWEWWDRAAARRAMSQIQRYGHGKNRYVLEAALTQLDEWFENAQPYIRVEPYVLEEILRSGQIFNQVHTGGSNGYYDPGTRLALENVLYGHWDDVMAYGGIEIGDSLIDDDLGQYPIYGYWSQGPGFDSDLDHYGGIAIQLKEGVDATFTLGDSLDHTGAKGIAQSGQSYGQASDAFLGVGHPGKASLAALGVEVDKVLRHQELGEFIEPYIEAQYHQPVRFDDIKAVHISWDYVDEFDRYTDESLSAAKYLWDQLPKHVDLIIGGSKWEPNE